MVSPSSSLPGPFCQDEQREFLSLSRRRSSWRNVLSAEELGETAVFADQLRLCLDAIFYSILDRAQNIPTLSLNLLRSKERRLYSEHSLMMGSRVPAMPLPPLLHIHTHTRQITRTYVSCFCAL